MIPASEWDRLQMRINALEEQIEQQKHVYSEWLSENEVAALLGRSKQWLWRQRVEGKLSFTKVGRATFYPRADVMALLERGRVKRLDKVR